MVEVGVVPPYRLEELGWLLFQRLCDEVLGARLGIERNAWIGAADECARVAVLKSGSVEGAMLEAPCLVLVASCPPRQAVSDDAVTAWANRVLAPVVTRAAEVRSDRVRSVLVVSDVELDRRPARAPASGFLAGLGRDLHMPVRAVGPSWLGSALDADVELRRTLPFALGVVRELGDALGTGSSFDLGAARSLARVFVPTQAYARALAVVERHGFAVLAGPPEMGKTAIARVIALAWLVEGWQVIECALPEELWAAFDPGRRQVFVVDDAFGSTEYRPDAAERWALELERALRAVDDSHWLLWTSRPAPFAAGLRRIHREHGVERFPRPAEVQVDASALTTEEKALILLRHSQTACPADGPRTPAPAVVRLCGWEIVSDPHFTPERIRRFATAHLPQLSCWGLSTELVKRAIGRELREPTEGMRASLAALDPHQAAILVALLDSPPGVVSRRTLTDAVRRHDPAAPSGPIERPLAGLLDQILRRVGEDSVTWIHPSWRDLIIEEVASSADRRRRFLAVAGLDGLLVAFSTAGGTGYRVFPLLVDDADWDLLSHALTALASDSSEPELHRILLAVEEACAVARDDRELGETEALATSVLERIRDRWDGAVTIPLPQLEAWFRLNGRSATSVRPPSLDRTWIELLPTASLDLADDVDLQSLDDWLTLTWILRTHARELLVTYGYPEAQTPLFDALIVQAGRLALGRPPVANRDRLADLLRRAPRLAPRAFNDPVQADLAADLLEASDEGWFELRLDPGRPAPPASRHERKLVDRILSDL